MANEIQHITFANWLGNGGGVWLTHDSTGFTNGVAGDFGTYVYWDGVTPSTFANDLDYQCQLTFGLGAVRATLYQATEPVIIEFEFQDGTPGFGAELADENVPEIQLYAWYGDGDEPVITTIRDGDDSILGTGGARTGGAGLLTCTYTMGVSGGAVCAGTAAPRIGYFGTGTGGALAAGAGTVTVAYRVYPSAGTVVGGAGLVSVAYNIIPTGGAIIGQAEFSNGLKYRAPIVVPAGKVSADLTDFLLPVRVTLPADLASSVVVFTDSLGNVIPHDVVNYSPATGLLHAYVRCDLASATDNTIYIYFGE